MAQYACGYCGEMGHNKAGCPQRKAQVADREALRTDRLMQIIDKFEKFAANQEHILRELDLIWKTIHDLDIEATMGNRDIQPDPPKKSGTQSVMLDF